jgi:hypothetical protein
VRRQVVDQERDGTMDSLGGDDVIVVQDENEGIFSLRKVIK